MTIRRAVIRIKGVKTVTAKGKVYHYHRRTMTRLPGLPGSVEFLLELRRLDAKGEKAAGMPGTLGGLVNAYRASPEFQNLAATTRASYDVAFNILAPNAGRPLVTITTESLYELRDALAKVRGRTVVNHVIVVLGIVFGWAIKRRLVRGENPARGVDKLRRPKDAKRVNRPWTDAELVTVLDIARGQLGLALALAAYTGLRESDVVRVPWSCYDGEAFETRTQKTGQRVWIPAHPRLKAMLDSMKRDTETIVPGLTAPAFRSAFYRLTDALRAEGKIGEGLSIHGLRHTLGHQLAEAGCDAPTIAAVLGHSNSRMAEHYSRTANRDSLAAAAFRKIAEAENRAENRSTSP